MNLIQSSNNTMASVRAGATSIVEKKWIVITMLILGLWTQGMAQAIDFNACPNADSNLPATTVKATMTPINIGVANEPAAATMSIQEVTLVGVGPLCGGACPNPLPLDIDGDGDVMEISAVGNQVTISGIPDASLAGNTLRISLRATAATSPSPTTCDGDFLIDFQRAAADLVLVLDRSGSMGWGYDGNTSPSLGQRRWDGVVTGLGVLSTQLGALSLLPDDELGMRYFSSSVITPAVPFDANLVSLSINTGQLPVVAGGATPSGGTALGDGIIAGRDLLLGGDPGNTKTMIVLSDGVQNRGDQIDTGNPTQTNGGQDVNGPSDEISIYTVCLGSSGHNPALMSSISAANKGQHMNTVAGAAGDFSTFFSTHLVNMLAGSSPQHIAIVKDDFQPNANGGQRTSQTFKVNNGVSKVLVTLIVPSRLEPAFVSFQRNGEELIEVSDVFYSSGALTIAIGDGYDHTDLGGEWKVEASLFTSTSGAAVPYTMIQMVDDHFTNPDYDLGGSQLKVGQSISPSIGLTWGIEPVENANARVLILKPGEDLNHLVASAEVEYEQSQDDPGSPAEAKLAVLLQDPAFLAQIAASDQIINLSYNAQTKRYEGSYNDLDVAGTYTIYYLIDASDPQIGDIVRQHQESFVVSFADIDLDNSEVSIAATKTGTLMTFRPIASNGKLIGSGFANAIKLNAENASIQNIRDLGDGSYELDINGPLTGPGSISVAGEFLVDGNLSLLACAGPNAGFLQKIQCWLLRAGLPTWLIWVVLGAVLVILYFVFRRRP